MSVVNRTFVCMRDMGLFRTPSAATATVTVPLGTPFMFIFSELLLGDSPTSLRSTKYELFINKDFHLTHYSPMASTVPATEELW